MGEPGFWDNQERAKQTIQKMKPLNGLIKPYEELQAAAEDLQALAELCEEDPSLESEMETELAKVGAVMADEWVKKAGPEGKAVLQKLRH